MKQGFDTQKYLTAQRNKILERVSQFSKLYLEFGGKLIYDGHAARVLPGYEPDAKLQILRDLKDNLEIVYCISAKLLQKGKIRQDLQLTYADQTLTTLDDLKKEGIPVSYLVITRFEDEPVALNFKKRLENFGLKVCLQREIEGYPINLEKIVSEKGYGAQEYVETKKPIVLVTGAGPGSGKMSFCLSQVYSDHLHHIDSGFAKFETFPIWNLDINNPINLVYEAATADLGDKIQIDHHHLKAYGIEVVNYNRDIENFEIIKRIIEKIVPKGNRMQKYRSPTDMGINMAREGIINEEICKEAARQEIIRRYFHYNVSIKKGIEKQETLENVILLMQKLNLTEYDRKIVEPARLSAEEAKTRGKGSYGIYCGAAIELPNGEIVTGKNSSLFYAESAVLLNAIKELASIPQEIDLLSPIIIESIGDLKKKFLKGKSENLNISQTLDALTISSKFNPLAEQAFKTLSQLKGCEMHTTHILGGTNEKILRKLGINVTTDFIPTRSIYLLR